MKPELIFRLPFDGTAEAAVGGQPKPLVARNLQFVPGRQGEALRVVGIPTILLKMRQNKRTTSFWQYIVHCTLPKYKYTLGGWPRWICRVCMIVPGIIMETRGNLWGLALGGVSSWGFC